MRRRGQERSWSDIELLLEIEEDKKLIAKALDVGITDKQAIADFTKLSARRVERAKRAVVRSRNRTKKLRGIGE